MPHFIRIEAVNFDNAIADTDNISVIRGGSLLLKQAIDDIVIAYINELLAISTGASIGVFKVLSDFDNIRQKIIDYLNEAPKDQRQDYRYFTFVVEECKDQDYLQAKEILMAKCRYAQLQQLSLSPDYEHVGDNPVPCEVEGIRPSNKIVHWPGDNDKKTSEFVKIKWDYGRKRQEFYQDELLALDLNDEQTKELRELDYTPDLDKLSGYKHFKNLDGKVAFIYFDGNGFSKLQNKLVNSVEEQQEFDQQIKNLRREFLKTLLEKVKSDRLWGGYFEKEGKREWLIRLETLLWGGDEMLFVVPAWKGFELLQLFYDCSKNWKIKMGGTTSPALTHAGGMVFCYHKTPIYKVRDLAKKLADDIKDCPGGREANYFNYLILESVDYPAESLNDFFKHKYNDLAQFRGYLNSNNLSLDSDQFSEIAEYLPKSQIYDIARAACQIIITIKDKNKPKKLTLDEYQEYETQVKRLKDVSSSPETANKCIEYIYRIFQPYSTTTLTLQNTSDEALPEQQLISQAIAWLHLVELWDYFIEVMQTQRGVVPAKQCR